MELIRGKVIEKLLVTMDNLNESLKNDQEALSITSKVDGLIDIAGHIKTLLTESEA